MTFTWHTARLSGSRQYQYRIKWDWILALALVRGSNGPPWFFVNNSRKRHQLATELSVPSFWSIWHVSWKFWLPAMSGRSYNVIHMSGHVPTKSADFLIYRIWVSFIAFYKVLWHCMQNNWCLWISRNQIQLLRGQGHARSCMSWAVSLAHSVISLLLQLSWPCGIYWSVLT